MAQLNLFDGGLSTRVAPHLISVNQAVVYSNVDPSRGPLFPIMDDTYENKLLEKSFHFFNSQWVDSSSDRDYVEFQSKLYFSDGEGFPQKTSDGSTWNLLGITKPSNMPTVALGITGLLTGDYQYCYTYYNSTDGSESQPSPYSGEVTAALNTIDIPVVASSDPQVDTIKIYRLGGNFSVMSLVVDLVNTSATYSDNTIDTSIPATTLTSSQNGTPQEGLKYLTEANAMFFGAKADKLYFSDIAFVNAWSPYYFIDFDADITGIGATQNGLIVFTFYKTYILTGTSPTSLSKYLLNGNQGCVLHKSIQFVKNTLVWLSLDGVCASSGTDVQVITRDKLAKFNLTPLGSAVNDNVYHLAHTTGILVIDFRYGLVFRELTNLVKGIKYVNNLVYFTDKDKKLHTLSTDSVPKFMAYKSPKFPDGSLSNLKNYRTIYVSNTGDLELTIFIDDKLVLSTPLVEGVHEVKLPQDRRQGYFIQFEVRGTGTISEIEYKLETRQNGR